LESITFTRGNQVFDCEKEGYSFTTRQLDG
jgi:hypothetical protein